MVILVYFKVAYLMYFKVPGKYHGKKSTMYEHLIPLYVNCQSAFCKVCVCACLCFSSFNSEVSLALPIAGFFQCSVCLLIFFFLFSIVLVCFLLWFFSLWLGAAVSNIISCPWHWIKLKPIQQEGVCLSSSFRSFVLSFFNILQTQREWGMIYLTLPVPTKTWH